MRDVTRGEAQTRLRARNMRDLVAALEERYPGIAARLLRGSQLRPGLIIVVNGINAQDGLLTKLEPGSEVHFIPALSGGT